jgi:hypothetical protein
LLSSMKQTIARVRNPWSFMRESKPANFSAVDYLSVGLTTCAASVLEA